MHLNLILIHVFFVGHVCQTFGSSVSSACPKDWEHMVSASAQDMCYYMPASEQMTWDDAMDQCTQDNAYLAMIKTAEEKTFLTEKYTWKPEYFIGGRGTGVGLEYKWLDGTAIDLTVIGYAVGQPDIGGDGCLVTGTNTLGLLADVTCSKSLPFLCQKAAAASITISWVSGQTGTCDTICQQSRLQAVASGTTPATKQSIHVCSIDITGEGETKTLPGFSLVNIVFQLPPCKSVHESAVQSLDLKKCLCEKPATNSMLIWKASAQGETCADTCQNSDESGLNLIPVTVPYEDESNIHYICSSNYESEGPRVGYEDPTGTDRNCILALGDKAVSSEQYGKTCLCYNWICDYTETQWSNWSECSTACNYGSRSRFRQKVAANPDEHCPNRREVQYESCNANECHAYGTLESQWCAARNGLYINSACFYMVDANASIAWSDLFNLCNENDGSPAFIHDTSGLLNRVWGFFLNMVPNVRIWIAVKQNQIAQNKSEAYWMDGLNEAVAAFMLPNLEAQKTLGETCFALEAKTLLTFMDNDDSYDTEYMSAESEACTGALSSHPVSHVL